MKATASADTLPPRGHNAKRTSIVEAAGAVFCREGFAGANIDLIAAEAGVCRARPSTTTTATRRGCWWRWVRDLTERSNAGVFATLGTFPDHPQDLEAELTAFAVRLNSNCICNREGKFLRKLIQAESERYPELFAEWRKQGPGRTMSALAARFARLAHAGLLVLDDPDLAARQFLALVGADLQLSFMLGGTPSQDEVMLASANGVRSFLRAFGRQPAQGDRPAPAS